MAAPAPESVLHLAALHTLASAGFASTSRAASLTLSDTLARYLRLVALTCTERASLAGRNKVAAIDVLEALEDLGVGGIGELQEWTAGLDQQVCFNAPGLSVLGKGAREGLVDDRPIADLTMVQNEKLPGDLEDEDEDEDVDMDRETEAKVEGDYPLFFPEPDLSWLPPLPGTVDIADAPHAEPTTTTSTAPAASLSIIDRYRRRIPYAQSQLSAAHSFTEPPSSTLPPLPAPTSSFPALASAFSATRGEPSVALRLTPLRQQASELLRRTIASPDEYTPEDTLYVPIPPPRSTPIIPSHSDTIPANLIPLNPNPTGVLSRLVHLMHSPHLPPALRERLTSVRPPKPLLRDGQPVVYGDPVRGPSQAALARARGKAQEAEEADQGYVRATWPVPPRGVDKWGKAKLPTGKKVVQSKEGEDKPRTTAGSRRAPSISIPAVSTPSAAVGTGTPGGSGTGNKIKLRIGGDTLPPTPGGASPLAPPQPPTPSATSPATTPGPSIGLKLKFGGSRNVSGSSEPSKDEAKLTTTETLAVSKPTAGTSPTPALPTPGIRLRLSASTSPLPPPAPVKPDPAQTQSEITQQPNKQTNSDAMDIDVDPRPNQQQNVTT